MKICICCSLSFTDEVKKIAASIEKTGHEVLLPKGILLDLIHKPDYDPVAVKADESIDPIFTPHRFFALLFSLRCCILADNKRLTVT